MQRMMKIGMLSIAFALLLTPAVSAETGVGITITQRELVCHLGRTIDTDQIPAIRSDARVVVAGNCSTIHAQYDARNVNLVCPSRTIINGPTVHVRTLPDNPPPYGPAPQYADPYGCWVQVDVLA